MPVSGIGGCRILSPSVLDNKVLSRIKDFSLSLPCYVLPAIVDDLPACPISIDKMDVSKKVLDDLAGPAFAKAEKRILKRVQIEMFYSELQSLREGKELLMRSRLRCLNRFMKNGLILVSGRLNNIYCTETGKHPIVLPAEHKVTQIIFRQKHAE